MRRRLPCGIYHAKDGAIYLAVYNYQHDIYSRLPSGFEKARRVVHFSYMRGGKRGGADVFELKPGCSDPKEIALIKKHISPQARSFFVDHENPKKSSYVTRKEMNEAYKRCDIQAELVTVGGSKSAENALELSVADISHFCVDKKGKPTQAKKPRGSKIERVRRITPITKIDFINPFKIITGGKQTTTPGCILTGNRDYGQGCGTTWIPGENASFDGENFTDYFSFRWGECYYCYAERKHRCFPKTIYRADESREREELMGACKLGFNDKDDAKPLGRPLDILRFGKRTEVWTPWTKDNFVRTLEMMIDSKTKGVIVTKLMPFNHELVKLIKRTGSTVLYSRYKDEYESGAVELGATNEQRKERALRYDAELKGSRGKAALYEMIIAHLPPTEEQHKTLRLPIRIQLLPARFRQKVVCKEMTGESWDWLKGESKRGQGVKQGDLVLDNFGNYFIAENNELTPRCDRIHPEWLKLIANNHGRIRMCHHDHDMGYCGECHQGKGKILSIKNKYLEN